MTFASRINLLSVTAAVMLLSFFLPWIEIFGEAGTGFQLAQLGPPATSIWAVPALAITVICLGVLRLRAAQALCGIAAAVAVIGGIVWAWRAFGDALFKSARPGGMLLLAANLIALGAAFAQLRPSRRSPIVVGD